MRPHANFDRAKLNPTNFSITMVQYQLLLMHNPDKSVLNEALQRFTRMERRTCKDETEGNGRSKKDLPRAPRCGLRAL